MGFVHVCPLYILVAQSLFNKREGGWYSLDCKRAGGAADSSWLTLAGVGQGIPSSSNINSSVAGIRGPKDSPPRSLSLSVAGAAPGAPNRSVHSKIAERSFQNVWLLKMLNNDTQKYYKPKWLLWFRKEQLLQVRQTFLESIFHYWGIWPTQGTKSRLTGKGTFIHDAKTASLSSGCLLLCLLHHRQSHYVGQ